MAFVGLGAAWRTASKERVFLLGEDGVLETETPRSIIKAAFQDRILSDGQVWIDMLEHRNLLSRTHDGSLFEQAVVAVRDRYLTALEELRLWLSERRSTE